MQHNIFDITYNRNYDLTEWRAGKQCRQTLYTVSQLKQGQITAVN